MSGIASEFTFGLYDIRKAMLDYARFLSLLDARLIKTDYTNVSIDVENNSIQLVWGDREQDCVKLTFKGDGYLHSNYRLTDELIRQPNKIIMPIAAAPEIVYAIEILIKLATRPLLIGEQ